MVFEECNSEKGKKNFFFLRIVGKEMLGKGESIGLPEDGWWLRLSSLKELSLHK